MVRTAQAFQGSTVLANDRQYLVTLGRAKRFRRALVTPDKTGLHTKSANATRAGLRSQLADLEAEIAEYRARRKGSVMVPARQDAGRGGQRQ